MPSYRVGVKVNDHSIGDCWLFNSVRFATLTDAFRYGSTLLVIEGRLLKTYKVIYSALPPNRFRFVPSSFTYGCQGRVRR
jgi:hypothetical protein